MDWSTININRGLNYQLRLESLLFAESLIRDPAWLGRFAFERRLVSLRAQMLQQLDLGVECDIAKFTLVLMIRPGFRRFDFVWSGRDGNAGNRVFVSQRAQMLFHLCITVHPDVAIFTMHVLVFFGVSHFSSYFENFSSLFSSLSVIISKLGQTPFLAV